MPLKDVNGREIKIGDKVKVDWKGSSNIGIVFKHCGSYVYTVYFEHEGGDAYKIEDIYAPKQFAYQWNIPDYETITVLDSKPNNYSKLVKLQEKMSS